jgi:hypothetical protein
MGVLEVPSSTINLNLVFQQAYPEGKTAIVLVDVYHITADMIVGYLDEIEAVAAEAASVLPPGDPLHPEIELFWIGHLFPGEFGVMNGDVVWYRSGSSVVVPRQAGLPEGYRHPSSDWLTDPRLGVAVVQRLPGNSDDGMYILSLGRPHRGEPFALPSPLATRATVSLGYESAWHASTGSLGRWAGRWVDAVFLSVQPKNLVVCPEVAEAVTAVFAQRTMNSTMVTAVTQATDDRLSKKPGAALMARYIPTEWAGLKVDTALYALAGPSATRNLENMASLPRQTWINFSRLRQYRNAVGEVIPVAGTSARAIGPALGLLACLVVGWRFRRPLFWMVSLFHRGLRTALAHLPLSAVSQGPPDLGTPIPSAAKPGVHDGSLLRKAQADLGQGLMTQLAMVGLGCVYGPIIEEVLKHSPGGLFWRIALAYIEGTQPRFGATPLLRFLNYAWRLCHLWTSGSFRTDVFGHMALNTALIGSSIAIFAFALRAIDAPWPKGAFTALALGLDPRLACDAYKTLFTSFFSELAGSDPLAQVAAVGHSLFRQVESVAVGPGGVPTVASGLVAVVGLAAWGWFGRPTRTAIPPPSRAVASPTESIGGGLGEITAGMAEMEIDLDEYPEFDPEPEQVQPARDTSPPARSPFSGLTAAQVLALSTELAPVAPPPAAEVVPVAAASSIVSAVPAPLPRARARRAARRRPVAPPPEVPVAVASVPVARVQIPALPTACVDWPVSVEGRQFHDNQTGPWSDRVADWSDCCSAGVYDAFPYRFKEGLPRTVYPPLRDPREMKLGTNSSMDSLFEHLGQWRTRTRAVLSLPISVGVWFCRPASTSANMVCMVRARLLAETPGDVRLVRRHLTIVETAIMHNPRLRRFPNTDLGQLYAPGARTWLVMHFDPIVVSPEMEDAWLANFSGAKKARNAKALLEIREQGFRFTDKGCNRVTVMAKTDETLARLECFGDNPTPAPALKPRCIEQFDPRCQAYLGPAVHEVAERLATLWAYIGDPIISTLTGYSCALSLDYRVAYAYRPTASLLTLWFAESLKDLGRSTSSFFVRLIVAGDDHLVLIRTPRETFFLEGDVSMCDQSQCEPTIRRDVARYRLLGLDDDRAETIIKLCRCTMVAGLTKQKLDLSFKIHPLAGTKMTGGPDTSVGTTIAVGESLMVSLLRTFHHSWSSAGSASRFSLEVLRAEMMRFGFKMKFETWPWTPSTDFMPLTFLKGWWVPSLDAEGAGDIQYVWTPLPSRLFKVGVAEGDVLDKYKAELLALNRPATVREALKFHLESVAQGMTDTFLTEPLRSFCNRWANVDVVPAAREWQVMYDADKTRVPTASWIRQFEHRYGFGEEWLEEVVALYALVDPPALVVHPALGRMVRRDYA